MKKTLIAVAALAATGAFAQVSVYGRVDAGLQQITQTTNGIDTKNTAIKGDGYNTNLWGIKASDDLGGGMKANVQLEAGFDPATGDFANAAGANAGKGNGFNRISTLGVSGGFGTADLGRYYTPTFLTAGSIDPFATTGATTVNLYPEGVRASSALHYVSPTMSGLSVRVMHNLAQDASATNPVAMGFSVTYAQGPLMVAAASGSIDTKAANKQEGTALVASYDMKVAKIGLGLTSAKGTNGLESSETNLTLTAPFGKITLLAAYGMNKKDLTATTNVTGSDFVIGATYAMSARTALYAKTGNYNVIDSGTTAQNVKTNALAIGLRTSF